MRHSSRPMNPKHLRLPSLRSSLPMILENGSRKRWSASAHRITPLFQSSSSMQRALTAVPFVIGSAPSYLMRTFVGSRKMVALARQRMRPFDRCRGLRSICSVTTTSGLSLTLCGFSSKKHSVRTPESWDPNSSTGVTLVGCYR